MRYRRRNLHYWRNQLVRSIPDWFKRKAGRRGAVLLILACVYWQVSEHMTEQEVYYALVYARAKIELYFGLDPDGLINISMPKGDFQIYRDSVERFMELDIEWHLFRDTVSRGLKLALLFIFTLFGWTFGQAYIEKQFAERQRAQDKSDGQIALEKQQEAYRVENRKPAPSTQVEPMKTSVDDEFELPEVGLLTELIDEPEDDFSVTQSDSDGQSEAPPVVAPLRLPGRIYRDDN